MSTSSGPGFIPSLPSSSLVSSSFTSSLRCPPRRRHRHASGIAPPRLLPTARVRRGRKPEPIIRESLFDVELMKDIDFKPFDFSSLEGKVVFVLNVASEDDHTDTVYTFLTNLLDKYHSEGFEVLAFPCNWYGQKETGTGEQIKAFVHGNYTDKIKVMNNSNIEWNEVFALGEKYFPGEIIWNFHGKFLFNRKGIPVDRFDLLSEDDYIESCVRRVLAGLPKQQVVEGETQETESEPEKETKEPVLKKKKGTVQAEKAVAEEGKTAVAEAE